ncbi:phosphoribosyl-ATP diphosphatase [Clostridium magnum]|uniref:Phosphoribosyl-ATP pyrophosphatase n=1 Tax=Clostridium magnum DSM 2767 TaxID=1121326 RepID=A0A162UUB9_9CLOT|nr:phosphoribosyl-ATP diphosphatase [Clostridium magnum]KZL94293.1 phosphoribosyl-ATP pyrophosphatase [Clostridium magnum DSM 2767]SHH90818.1 phosphoribosyl-ATP pyrophosphatase [Clostridium magnum DSM 2767]
MEIKSVVEQLYEVIKERRGNPVEGSYTSYLFEKGLDKILKKVGEEATEVIIASKNNNKIEEVSEICDLIYHLIVLMANQGIDIEDIAQELDKRREKTCNKKAERKPIENI